MDDNRETQRDDERRRQPPEAGTSDTTHVQGDGPPVRGTEPEPARVRAVPVIDQPPGDAQPPEVAGHDD